MKIDMEASIPQFMPLPAHICSDFLASWRRPDRHHRDPLDHLAGQCFATIGHASWTFEDDAFRPARLLSFGSCTWEPHDIPSHTRP